MDVTELFDPLTDVAAQVYDFYRSHHPSTVWAAPAWFTSRPTTARRGRYDNDVSPYVGVTTVAADPFTPTTAYAGSANGYGLLKTVNGGNDWVATAFPTPMSPSGGRPELLTVFAISGGVWRSRDGGDTVMALSERRAGPSRDRVGFHGDLCRLLLPDGWHLQEPRRRRHLRTGRLRHRHPLRHFDRRRRPRAPLDRLRGNGSEQLLHRRRLSQRRRRDHWDLYGTGLEPNFVYGLAVSAAGKLTPAPTARESSESTLRPGRSTASRAPAPSARVRRSN